MHVLFIHKNFPAQFGHLAAWLVRERGWRCTFLSEHPPRAVRGIACRQYTPIGGAREQTHFLSRTFENAVGHAHGVYAACAAETGRPDLIVGHSGFGSTVFLSELWPGVPVISYFEYFYHPHGTDLDFRPDFAPSALELLRARARNAMVLLDLQYATAGYSPTHWQRALFPAEYQGKISTLFDGVDLTLWNRHTPWNRRAGGQTIPAEMRVVTYVSRGFESLRGFDIFMQVAKRICAARSDVVFVVVGKDQICYGCDARVVGGPSFKDYVLARDDYDLSRFIFTGTVPPRELAQILTGSDLHLYLTVPFVLSWSLLNALACGCTVLASDTAPVREMIQHEVNGLLAGFFDVDGLTREALRVLDDPEAFRVRLGQAGSEKIAAQYSSDVMAPQLAAFYEKVALQAK